MSDVQGGNTPWNQIGDIKRWIDQQSPVDDATALTMRVMKIGEEYGEACEALLAPGPEDKPELVNQQPYGDGWIAVLEVADPAGPRGLMDAGSYRKHIGEG